MKKEFFIIYFNDGSFNHGYYESMFTSLIYCFYNRINKGKNCEVKYIQNEAGTKFYIKEMFKFDIFTDQKKLTK